MEKKVKGAMRIDGAKVRNLRLSRGWSQKTLAEESGLAKRTIENIESERHTVQPATAAQLSDALGVSVTSVLKPAEPLNVAIKELPNHSTTISDRSCSFPAREVACVVMALIIFYLAINSGLSGQEQLSDKTSHSGVTSISLEGTIMAAIRDILAPVWQRSVTG